MSKTRMTACLASAVLFVGCGATNPKEQIRRNYVPVVASDLMEFSISSPVSPAPITIIGPSETLKVMTFAIAPSPSPLPKRSPAPLQEKGQPGHFLLLQHLQERERAGRPDYAWKAAGSSEADVATAPLVLLAILLALLVASLKHVWRRLLGSLIHAVDYAAFLADIKKEPTWLAVRKPTSPMASSTVAPIAAAPHVPSVWSQSDRSLEESWDDETEDGDETVDLADEVLLTRLSRLEDEIAEIKELILRRSGRKP